MVAPAEEERVTPAASSEPFDVGAIFTIRGPGVNQILVNDSAPAAAHYNAFATINTAPGGGVSGDPPFLVPGSYTLDNGGGGANLSPFIAALHNPAPVRWENTTELAYVDRSSGLTIRWSGGEPDGVVNISGTLQAVQDTVTYGGTFICAARTGAGKFFVPPFITRQIPTGASPTQSRLKLGAIIEAVAFIPGIDFTYYSSSQALFQPVVFQ